MTVLYGPDGLPITKQKEVPLDLVAVHDSEMATEAGRTGVVRKVQQFQMHHAMDRAQMYDLVVRHDSRVTLGASDEHGDMQVYFNGEPVKLKIYKDVAEQLGYWDPTGNKVPHWQEDL